MRRAPTALYWCGNVVIDRRSDQLGKVHEERCMKDEREKVREDEGRRWVLLKIPRCDIDGVGEGK